MRSRLLCDEAEICDLDLDLDRTMPNVELLKFQVGQKRKGGRDRRTDQHEYSIAVVDKPHL